MTCLACTWREVHTRAFPTGTLIATDDLPCMQVLTTAPSPLTSPFPQLRERLQKALERSLMTAAERNDVATFLSVMQDALAFELPEHLLLAAQERATAVAEQAR